MKKKEICSLTTKEREDGGEKKVKYSSRSKKGGHLAKTIVTLSKRKKV
jgi:hypothetical protein